jgi:hypothetical protein
MNKKKLLCGMMLLMFLWWTTAANALSSSRNAFVAGDTCIIFPILGNVTSPPISFILALQNYLFTTQVPFRVISFINGVIEVDRTFNVNPDAVIFLGPADLLIPPGTIADTYICWAAGGSLFPPGTALILLFNGALLTGLPAATFVVQ